jgi:hypothetical protein
MVHLVINSVLLLAIPDCKPFEIHSQFMYVFYIVTNLESSHKLPRVYFFKCNNSLFLEQSIGFG